MTNSRNLDDLLPQVHVKATTFLNACKAAGLDVRITSTYRDFAEQERLYEIGRTVPGDGATKGHPLGLPVTNAKPGESWHNWRRAFDFVPMRDGVCLWADSSAFAKCGAIAESIGLEWAGRWHRFPERAHCQLTEGHTLAELNHQYPRGLDA
jgi:peptidoglycan L-alanyl-D-glutamate endopeptidase CwlK